MCKGNNNWGMPQDGIADTLTNAFFGHTTEAANESESSRAIGLQGLQRLCNTITAVL